MHKAAQHIGVRHSPSSRTEKTQIKPAEKSKLSPHRDNVLAYSKLTKQGDPRRALTTMHLRPAEWVSEVQLGCAAEAMSIELWRVVGRKGRTLRKTELCGTEAGDWKDTGQVLKKSSGEGGVWSGGSSAFGRFLAGKGVSGRGRHEIPAYVEASGVE